MGHGQLLVLVSRIRAGAVGIGSKTEAEAERLKRERQLAEAKAGAEAEYCKRLGPNPSLNYLTRTVFGVQSSRGWHIDRRQWSWKILERV